MDYKKIIISKDNNYHICQMNNGKSNALDTEMIKELSHFFKSYQKDHGKGVIITGHGNIFTVGLDMKEMLSMNENEFQNFYDHFLELVEAMVQFPFPLVAAVNGHCPAGGCVLAICADYRIMTDNDAFEIGLNELPVGIMVPPSIFHLFKFWIGTRNAYHNLTSGKMLNPREAKLQGLIDELTTQRDTLNIAKLKMEEYLSFDQPTWRGIKSNLRMGLINKMKMDTTNNHIGTVAHFVNNNGKQILMQKLMELQQKKN